MKFNIFNYSQQTYKSFCQIKQFYKTLEKEDGGVVKKYVPTNSGYKIFLYGKATFYLNIKSFNHYLKDYDIIECKLYQIISLVCNEIILLDK